MCWLGCDTACSCQLDGIKLSEGVSQVRNYTFAQIAATAAILRPGTYAGSDRIGELVSVVWCGKDAAC